MYSLDDFEILLTSSQINDLVHKVAEDIRGFYQQDNFTAVCLLKGGVHFFSDLTRKLHDMDMVLDFIKVSSYGKSDTSCGELTIHNDLSSDLSGQRLLLVDDVFDTGLTLYKLKQEYERRGAEVKLCVFIDKGISKYADVISPDFAALKRNTGFLIGYGLDYAEKWRNLPSIYTKKS